MSKTWECGKCGRNNPPHRRKCQTWNCRERGPRQEDGGYWDCGCGCESNATAGAELSQASVCADVPMMEKRPGRGPIGGGRTRATAYLAGDPGCIHRSSHAGRGGRRGRVQALLSALRPLKTRLRAAQEAHDKANKKYKALVEEEEEFVKALLLAKQKLTQEAKEARDAKAEELEEVEAEARTARDGSARSPSPMSPAQWVAGLQNALDGEVKESFNQGSSNSVSRRISPCINNSRPKCRRSCRCTVRLLVPPQSGTTVPVEGAVQCGDNISARVEIPTTLGPERGLEMLTAVQWRQKLGLMDFRSDCLYGSRIHGCGLLKLTALRSSSFTPMVPRSSLRRGRAVLRVLDGVSSWLGSHMMALTDVSWEQRLLRAGWRVSFRPPRHLHQSAPSAPTAELTAAAAAVGLLLEEGKSGARLRCRFDLCPERGSATMQGQRQHCHGQPRSWFTVSGTTTVACRDLPRPQPYRRAGQRVRGSVGRNAPSRSEMEPILEG